MAELQRVKNWIRLTNCKRNHKPLTLFAENESRMKKILIINNAEPEIQDFVRSLEDIVKSCEIEVSRIEYADCLKTDLSAFDGILMSGSPQGDDIVEHHAPYFAWIRTYQKPVLGICAGHHITGYLYGSKLLYSQEPESGDFEIKLLTDDPLLESLPRNLSVKQMHNDSISLPEDFLLLATSDTCRNQLMRHKNKPLYTCQFHPEFYNHKLIQNFITIC